MIKMKCPNCGKELEYMGELFKDKTWEIDNQFHKSEKYGCSCGFFATKHAVFDLELADVEWWED